MSGYQVARVDELDAIPVGDGLVWHPVRRRFGIRAYGMNLYSAESVGGHVVERHDEASLGHEEVYFVVAGHARFTLDGEDVDAPSGTFVYISDPSVTREAVSEAEGTTVLAVGGKPGEAFQPSVWENWFAAIPYSRAGDHAGAAEVMREGLATHPEHPSLLYNLACEEAQAGQADEAFEHLQAALARRERLREHARTDADLESLHDDPRWAELLG